MGIVLRRDQQIVAERRQIDEAVQHSVSGAEVKFRDLVPTGGQAPLQLEQMLLLIEYDGMIVDRRSVIHGKFGRVYRDASGPQGSYRILDKFQAAFESSQVL